MSYMFSGCSLLTDLNLNLFNTDAVTTMKSMFSSCNKISSLDLSSFNNTKCYDFTDIFDKIKIMTIIVNSTTCSNLIKEIEEKSYNITIIYN